MIRLVSFLVFFSFLALSETAFSQKKGSGDDVYGKDNLEFRDQKKLPMIDDKTFVINDFVDGYICFPDNTLKHGTVRFNGRVVVFKDSITQKSTRYSAGELKGFIALADTFKISVDSSLMPPDPHQRLAKKRYFVDSKYVKEMMYGEKVCLYKIHISQQAPTSTFIGSAGSAMMMPSVSGFNTERNIFYLKRKIESAYTEVPKGKRAFKKMIAVYFKDNTGLVKAIDEEKYHYDELDQIVDIYNQNKVLN
jgi:hypothetical protein